MNNCKQYKIKKIIFVLGFLFLIWPLAIAEQPFLWLRTLWSRTLSDDSKTIAVSTETAAMDDEIRQSVMSAAPFHVSTSSVYFTGRGGLGGVFGGQVQGSGGGDLSGNGVPQILFPIYGNGGGGGMTNVTSGTNHGIDTSAGSLGNNHGADQSGEASGSSGSGPLDILVEPFMIDALFNEGEEKYISIFNPNPYVVSADSHFIRLIQGGTEESSMHVLLGVIAPASSSIFIIPSVFSGLNLYKGTTTSSQGIKILPYIVDRIICDDCSRVSFTKRCATIAARHYFNRVAR